MAGSCRTGAWRSWHGIRTAPNTSACSAGKWDCDDDRGDAAAADGLRGHDDEAALDLWMTVMKLMMMVMVVMMTQFDGDPDADPRARLLPPEAAQHPQPGTWCDCEAPGWDVMKRIMTTIGLNDGGDDGQV
jgi:hypothetical protein